MNRLDNWQSNLSELIESKRETAFVWGEFDCTQLAFMAIEAVIGVDHSGPYRGKYKTAAGALKILRKVGKVETPVQLIEGILGEPQAIAFARKGDIVTAIPNDELTMPSAIDVFGPVLGVCYGARSFFVGEHGLIEVDTLKLERAYHVLSR